MQPPKPSSLATPSRASPVPAPHWHLHRDADNVAWLSLDKADASTNSLSRAVVEELNSKLSDIEASLPKALVITSAKQGFIAGADIKEFVGIHTPEQAYQMIREGQQVLDRLASLKCVTVAAINGFALGGGLEVALACRYRVAADDDRVTLGFPEVQLGVHPGLGGTVRSVSLIGPIAAMDLMLTGRSVRARKALEMGLVDKLAPSEQLQSVAKQVALQPPPFRKPSIKNRLLNSVLIRPLLARRMRKQVARRARPAHYPAPYALIDLWQRFGGRGVRAYDAEAHSMAELLCTATSRNLVRVFFLQERLKAAGKYSFDPVSHVHVVGAGVMGGDIAAWCAARGLTVTLQDRAMQYVAPALDRARVFFEKRFKDPQQREQAMARLTADVEGQRISQADVVIEAIYENLEAKRELYGRIEPRMKKDAVLATNTSSIVLEQLSQALTTPSRLIGLHFFNPVARMPLLEVIRAEDTQKPMVQRGMAFARQIDKLAISCRSSPGFLVNRVLMPYLSEAMRAAEEGIPLALIDRAAEDFGMPTGPIELADVVGLDVILGASKVFQASDISIPDGILRLEQQKKFGKKSGEGLYVWKDGKPQKASPGSYSAPVDLQDRLILPLINEAVAVLREHIVDDADLVDAGIIFGTGFAPFRGGPIQYARGRGIATIIGHLEQLQAKYGERFTPDAGWQLLR